MAGNMNLYDNETNEEITLPRLLVTVMRGHEWYVLNVEKPSGNGSSGKVRCCTPGSWGGDDVPANIAPLCSRHHLYVTERRDKEILERLAESLTDDEYAYCIGKLGEGALERLFGVLT